MNTAQDLVQQTFESDFDRAQFGDFINRLLKSADFRKHFSQSGGNVRQAFRDKVNSFERIAQFTDVEGNKIDILVVNLRRDSTIERGRTSLRNFAADYLQSDRGLGKAAVLVAYVSESKRDWRFSYVTLEKSLVRQESGRFKETVTTLTPARRFSFLVGREEKTHTAQKQFFNLLQSQSAPTLRQIEEAFSIEKVTNDFYKDYEKLFRRLEKEIESLRDEDPQLDGHLQENFIENADFSKKLLGQIVFLYFLQKKGWFGVERGAEWGSGNKNFLRYLFEHRAKLGTRQERRARKDVNFFNDILEHLFYDALARERDEDYYARFDCKIPFLNGGLFEAAYKWGTVDVLLPDSLFSNDEPTKEGDKGTGILDVFDRYNFTVNEAEPLEKDVAVDPEMLGKVFENLLPENERKGKGSFYTPRRIVNYMCQQSLISYLATHLPDVPRADIETFIHVGDFRPAYEAAGTKKHEENFLPEGISTNAARIDALLEVIAVCDPAIGSGAFPVGMMQEIVRARSALTDTLAAAKSGKSRSERERFDRSRSAYELKRHVIQSSLYGVDIDPGAVEIAKLRLWLSLVVDEDERERVQALPNLDYKIMQGNALLDEFAGVKLIDDAVFEKPAADVDAERAAIQQRIRELERQLYALHGKGAEARQLKRKFSKETDRLVRQSRELTQPKAAETVSLLPDDPYREARDTLDEIRRQIDEYFSLTSPTEKRDARARIERLEWRFMEQTLTARGEQDALKELALHRRDNRKPYFLWKLYFSDIFQDKGGFDIVIGNPPYLGGREWKEGDDKQQHVLLKKFTVADYQFDIYALFWEQGIVVARPEGGVIAYITPNTWLNNRSTTKLRNFILRHTTVRSILDCSRENVFDAVVLPVVTVLQKTFTPANEVEILKPTEYGATRSHVIAQDLWAEDGDKIFNIDLRAEDIRLRKIIEDGAQALASLATVKFGIKVYETGKGIPPQKASDAKQNIFEATRKVAPDYRRYLEGRDIERYKIKWQDKWLKYGKNLAAPRDPQLFEGSRLLFRRIVGERLIGTFIDRDYVTSQLLQIVKPSDAASSKWLLGILNSSLLAYYFKKRYNRQDKTFPEIRIYELAALPIKTPDGAARQATITALVDYVLFLKANSTDETRDTLPAGYFEQLIDALVYELYLPDELHAADKRFFEPLAAERLPSLAEHEGDELRVIRGLFERLSDVNHPVRKNLYFLDNLESVRIIEGK